jgi:uncharacterized protein (DUF427 family)
MAVEPGMANGHTITIKPSNAHVEIVVNGTKVAESDRPVQLDETGLPTRYYLRREDVLSDLLPTSFQTTCPFKGQASYWSLKLDDETHDGIAWSYETPIEGAEGIKGLLCFFPERVEMKVDSAS